MAQATPAQIAELVAMQDGAQQKLTQAQRDENEAKFNALMGDEAAMAKFAEDDQAAFTAADADQDGKLNKAEFVDFSRKQESTAAAQGWHVATSTDAEIDEWWAKMTEVAGTPDALSKADYDAIYGAMMEAYAAKKGQWVKLVHSISSKE